MVFNKKKKEREKSQQGSVVLECLASYLVCSVNKHTKENSLILPQI